MTDKRSTITDALIARALAQRANGPDVDLVPAILVAAAATSQRTGWRVRLGPPPRSAVLVLAAGAIVASVVAVGVGSGWIRLPSVERPLPGNGAITSAGSGQIVEFDASTGEEHPGVLASVPPWKFIGQLDWSRDGARLAISTDQEVSIYDAATGTTRSIVPCGFCGATWSPDGAVLSIVDGGGERWGVITGSTDVISMIDPDDGHTISRIEPASASFDRIGGTSWSPDGRRLAVSGSDMAYSTARLAIMDRDGSNVRQISLPTPGWPIVDASWSPDGSTIAYIAFGVPDQDSRRSIQLALVDPDGVRPSRTFVVGNCACGSYNPALAWSPDGRSIAFTSTVDDTLGLYVANADGSGIQLTKTGRFGPMAWRPIAPPNQK